MIKFASIRLEHWRQFASVSLEFHPRLTVLTGSNGAGKSTILNICSQHFGYSRPFLSTPRRKKGGGIVYDLGYYDPLDPFGLNYDLYDEESDSIEDYQEDEQLELLPHSPIDIVKNTPNRQPGAMIEIGKIGYDNGAVSTLVYQENQTQSYGIQINNQQSVVGVPISSHRTQSNYQQVEGLSLQFVNLAHAYRAFLSDYINGLNGSHTKYSPLYRMKETLIAMAAFGEGNNHLEKNQVLLDAFNGFGDVLKRVLPREIGFQKLIVRIPDIVLKTRSGEFVLDASSGGVTAVIEIAWQLYLFSLQHKTFVATLDEPENHLHPSMQRSILSNLIEAFPQAQFIVATHSPFIVSAVEDSKVYALKYEGSVGQSGFPSGGLRRVRSVALNQTGKAGSATQILKEVLGVSVSIPDWATKKLESIIEEFESADINADTLGELRSKLSQSGFAEFYPEALAQLVKDK